MRADEVERPKIGVQREESACNQRRLHLPDLVDTRYCGLAVTRGDHELEHLARASTPTVTICTCMYRATWSAVLDIAAQQNWQLLQHTGRRRAQHADQLTSLQDGFADAYESRSQLRAPVC